MLSSTTRTFITKCTSSSPSSSSSTFRNQTKMDLRTTFRVRHSRSSSSSPSREDCFVDSKEGDTITTVSLQEWQGWGTTSQLPSMVVDIIEDMKDLEKNMDSQMNFGGIGGKLKGNFKVQEDKKHRATYQALNDSEKKLQFFSARQIACRLLGSKGYLCQKCWLALEDCMCSKVIPSSLWHGMRFWLYMHPKDFLRQNNTGKLLWQTFGVQAATLCIYGISEHEEVMWNAFEHAGKDMVWCLYPNKNALTKSVQDIVFHPEGFDAHQPKERAQLVWGEEDLPCISLTTLGASSMHRLRPQPSWDRTCTAAAAIGLLSELHLHPAFNSHGLDNQADMLEDSVDALLEALTSRRLRMGRSITRRERHKGDVC
ncbi:hypothetical protein AQUCO_08400037v1 [Aquilegia coerulea]|uniref:tRNA-uridine aminocarboxypropyltransferase n=1 Tax=Aquilegia coerulea TaxID=218851 RepID=A0A2G5C6S7_AQUCA|nr:hypothetical protein AQUCO_08400037v1 [Aquilegia coerulea]